MKNFRYKKHIPNDLGKIIFFEDLFPKKVLKQQFFSNLFSLFFSIFGLAVCISMFYHFMISNDLFGLIFALLFSPFFFYLYKSILDFFIIEIGVVCDKGIMILHLRSDDKVLKSKIFYFDTKYEIKIQERRNFHIAGRYKYTYDKICTFSIKIKKFFKSTTLLQMIKKAIKKSFLIIVFWLLRLLGLRESDLIKPLLLLSYNL